MGVCGPRQPSLRPLPPSTRDYFWYGRVPTCSARRYNRHAFLSLYSIRYIDFLTIFAGARVWAARVWCGEARRGERQRWRQKRSISWMAGSTLLGRKSVGRAEARPAPRGLFTPATQCIEREEQQQRWARRVSGPGRVRRSACVVRVRQGRADCVCRSGSVARIVGGCVGGARAARKPKHVWHDPYV